MVMTSMAWTKSVYRWYALREVAKPIASLASIFCFSMLGSSAAAEPHMRNAETGNPVRVLYSSTRECAALEPAGPEGNKFYTAGRWVPWAESWEVRGSSEFLGQRPSQTAEGKTDELSRATL